MAEQRLQNSAALPRWMKTQLTRDKRSETVPGNRAIFVTVIAATAACSTVQSRMDDPPIFDRTTPTTLAAFQSCFTAATASENVNYLPRGNGGTYKSTAGPQEYVLWIVNIDDLGTERRVAVHAVDSLWGPNKVIIAKVEGCVD